MKHRLEIIHLVSFYPTLKTSEIHNSFVLIPIWSTQVGNHMNIYYAVTIFIIPYRIILSLDIYLTYVY
jgi:hypothetical protein